MWILQLAMLLLGPIAAGYPSAKVFGSIAKSARCRSSGTIARFGFITAVASYLVYLLPAKTVVWAVVGYAFVPTVTQAIVQGLLFLSTFILGVRASERPIL